MNKILFKSLLLTLVATLWGSSAWATVTNATLDHTAGAQWGSNTGASTVDAEKEHYNNDASGSWAGCAYAKFSLNLPEGENVTKATLTYSVNQGGKSGRDDIIYYMASDFDLDWSTFAGQTGKDLRNAGSRAGKAVEKAATGGTGDRIGLSQDVTAAVQAIANAGQNYIIFQWTGNAGGADLYGKGSDNAPTLVVTTTAEQIYAVTFTETNGVSAKVVLNGVDVTSGTSLVNGTYNYTATAAGYKDYNGTFTVANEAANVSFTMVAKDVYSYTVNAVDGQGNSLGSVSSGTGYADENVTYYYPEFVLSGTTLYAKDRNNGNPYWGATELLDANEKQFTVSYGGEPISDVVFYKEAETIDGFTPKTTNNATIRCSGGTGGISTEETALTTLEEGKYKIFGQVWGTAGMTATVKAGNTVVWELATTGSLANATSAEFELTTTTDLTIVTTGGNDNHMLDLIYIQKTGEYVPPIVSTTLTYSITPDDAGTVSDVMLDDEGTQFVLTATANEGYKFKQWINGDVATNVEVLSTENPYTVTLNSDLYVVAQFVKTYTLTVDCDETKGSVTIDPEAEGGVYEENSVVDLHAIASLNSNCQFAGWVEVNGDGSETPINASAEYQVTMNRDIHLKALFETITYQLSLNYDQAQGTAEVTPANATNTYETGTELTLTATPAEGYEFVNWTRVDQTAEEVLSDQNPYAFAISSDMAVKANFKAVEPVEPIEDGVVFFADVKSIVAVALAPGETEINTDMADITGGTMSAINQQAEDKNLINKQGSDYYFCLTNNNTFFKVVLKQALQVGDVITANTYSRTDTSLGLFVSTAGSRPGECATKLSIDATETGAPAAFSSYTIKEGDDLVGATTIYIYRETGKSTYFDEFKITRGGEPEEIVPGDANLNGEVTVSDAVLATSFVLETVQPTEQQLKAADMDKSETIDVSDVMAIVNIILPDDEPQAGVRSAEAVDNFITLSGTDISLSNTNAFAAFQMDVTLDDGAQLNGVRMASRASKLSLAYNRIDDNTYRVVGVAYDKQVIDGHNGQLLTLDVTGNSQVAVDNVIFVDTKAKAYAVGMGHTTGISRVSTVAEGTDVYTVGGVKTTKLTKGLNVIRSANGEVRKVYVK